MNQTPGTTSTRPINIDLTTLTAEQLSALAQRVDRELEARAFEANLKREMESHQRRRQRLQRRA